MAEQGRRVWRAAPATLAVVATFMALAATVVPLLAVLAWQDRRGWLVPVLLAVLSVAALGYAWRFGLHPRLTAGPDGVTVTNPFSSARFAWADLRVVAPGEDGLVVATADARAEAWCVQKSVTATRHGRLTRADRVAAELVARWEAHEPLPQPDRPGLVLRRARAEEARTLTRVERAASEATLRHVFPPEEHPYPVTEVTRRWRRVLHDPRCRVRVAELDGEPVGLVAFDDRRVRHLAVLPEHGRHGVGSVLLATATREMTAAGAPRLDLWVLTGNRAARAFYRARGWTETDDRRDCEFPPQPAELRMQLTVPGR